MLAHHVVLARRFNLQHQLKITRGVVATCGEPGPRPVLGEVDTPSGPDQPSSDQRAAVVDDEVGAANLPGAQGGQLGGQPIRGVSKLCWSFGARCGFRRRSSPGAGADASAASATTYLAVAVRQDPAHLLAPTRSPETKCFWNAKNTIVVGTAAINAPAATTFHDVAKPP